MRLLHVPFKRPRRLTHEELSRMYIAARHMRRPAQGHPQPSAFWQSLLVLAYYTALRSSDLFKATWADLDAENQTLYVKIRKTGVEADLPLHPVVMAHLSRMNREPGVDRIFAIDRAYVYLLWKRLQKQAGVSFGLHDIRRTAVSEINAVRPGMGKVLLLHAPSGVTEKSYLNALPELREVVDGMEIPPAFRHGPKMTMRMLKEAKQVVTLRPHDFAVPVHPPRELFGFFPDGFMFGETYFQATPLRTALIRSLVQSGGICTQQALWLDVFKCPFPESYLQRGQLSGLLRKCRAFLKEQLRLPEQFNPIVATTRAGAGNVCRYELLLPPSLWQNGGAK